MSDDGLDLAYNPVPAASRVARAQSARFRVVVQSLVIIGLIVVIWALMRRHFDMTTWLWMLGGWVVVLVVLVVVQNVRVVSARRDLRAVGEGTAVHIGRDGLDLRRGLREAGDFSDVTPGPDLAGQPGTPSDHVAWSQVARVCAVGSSMGSGPSLVVADTAGRRWSVGLSTLDASSGAVESAVLAWSGGRVRLDVSRLDQG